MSLTEHHNTVFPMDSQFTLKLEITDKVIVFSLGGGGLGLVVHKRNTDDILFSSSVPSINDSVTLNKSIT